MVQHMIVPVDGSDDSWRAVDVAVALGRRGDAPVDVVEVVFTEYDLDEAKLRLSSRLVQHDTQGVTISTRAILGKSAAEAIAAEVDMHPEALVVMASHGRGRSAALLGSVAEKLLQKIYGPILVVGPRATLSRFQGLVVVTVDGSAESEAVLPLAAAWAIELRVAPWIIAVAEPDTVAPSDVSESAYPARLARKLSAASGHDVHFEMLHGKHVADAVASFAASSKASLIVASTHGRTGLARFVIGSTAAGFVHDAPCPVLLVRPAHMQSGAADQQLRSETQ